MSPILTLLILPFIFLGCSNEIKNKKRIQQNGYFIEANFIGDSLLDGKANYFNLDGSLTNVIYYSNGRKHGSAVTYFLNGKIWDSSTFYHGLQNGKHFIFLENGDLSYEDYYHYGREVGPHLTYRNAYIEKFIFSDFEMREVYSAVYDSGNIVNNSRGTFLNFSLYGPSVDNQRKLGLFMFLINPPHMKITYGLGVSDSLGSNPSELQIFSNKDVFVDTILPLLPLGRYYYVFAKSESNTGEKKHHMTVLHW